MGYIQLRIQKRQEGVSSTFTIDIDTFYFSEISKPKKVGSGYPGPPLHAPLISSLKTLRVKLDQVSQNLRRSVIFGIIWPYGQNLPSLIFRRLLRVVFIP